MQTILARAAWSIPVLLLLLAVHQANVASDVSETLERGVPVVATVTEYERVDRADVTYGYVSLRIPVPGGETMVREKLSLPHTLMQEIGDVATLDVRVLAGADQEVVVASVAKTQWKIAAIQAGISFIAAVMAFVGVLGWNRLLRRSRRVARDSTDLPSGHGLLHEGFVGP